jgi:hypothetical protein
MVHGPFLLVTRRAPEPPREARRLGLTCSSSAGVSYYAQNRDLPELRPARLFLYPDWEEVADLARRHLAAADVALVTSDCPDAVAPAGQMLEAPGAARSGARRVASLYGSVDPDQYRPAEPLPHYRADLSYLGTYAQDRQAKARAAPGRRPADDPLAQKVMGGGADPDEGSHRRACQRSSRRKGVSSAAGARARRARTPMAMMVARNGSIRKT